MAKILIILAAVAVFSGCSDSSDNSSPGFFTVSSYNMGLALNVVEYTNERLVANEELLQEYDSDVLCLQEVWLPEQVEGVTQALEENYPYIYTVEPEQVFSEDAACTMEEVAGFADCSREQCPGLTDSELVACAPVQCAAFIPELSPTCFEGVVAAVGLPGITVDSLVEEVTQPSGKFSYGGSLGLMMAAKYPLQNREFQDFIEDSTGTHRGALYAEVSVKNKTHVVGCTHPTANLSDTIPYPGTGKYGSWEAENRFMQEQMIAYVNRKAGDRPIFFGGDFNCSIANASTGVDADYAANCQLWLDDGFVDPAGEQLPCTFCYSENSLLMDVGRSGDTLLDHVFVKNLDNSAAIVAERVFDDLVSIEALVPPAELQPEDSPTMTHPSDHFGVEITVELR